MTVVLTGTGLTLVEVVAVARNGAFVELAPEARARMQQARTVVEEAVARGDEIYGVTTGVASRKRVRVQPEEVAGFFAHSPAFQVGRQRTRVEFERGLSAPPPPGVQVVARYPTSDLLMSGATAHWQQRSSRARYGGVGASIT